MVTAAIPGAVVQWLRRFEAAMAAPARADWSQVFAEECYWRDLLAFTWNIITLEGREAIRAMTVAQAALIGGTGFEPDAPALPLTNETQGWFTFRTTTARCRGHVQLRDGRAQVVLTAMVELIGHEELGGARRPDGIKHRAQKGRRTWFDERERRAGTLGHTVQPYCLIVGGGQNGLMLAARLKRLGVPTLVTDALEKPGDCWRGRYHSLYLHDPVFLDHLPYLPFPDHWPLYMSKDQMADWLAMCAGVMEIDFWGGTQCTAAAYEEHSGTWAVSVTRGGQTLTLRPKHLVLATGLSGAKHIPAIPGAARFAGRQYHSGDHGTAEGLAGKRCLVIGSNNSAHDVCVDLWEHDAQVTMIQRSPTIVVRADTMRDLAKNLYYAQPGADIDLGDLIGATMPFRPRLAFEKAFTDHVRQVDAAFYERLQKSGFQLWHGEDDTGFFMAYFRRAGGYYFDVGGSELIASGQIPGAPRRNHRSRRGWPAHGGRHVPARRSHRVCDRVSTDERMDGPAHLTGGGASGGAVLGAGVGDGGRPGTWEGELRNMWKPTAQEGLWFQGGNILQGRFHYGMSRWLKARMEGLSTPVYRAGPER